MKLSSNEMRIEWYQNGIERLVQEALMFLARHVVANVNSFFLIVKTYFISYVLFINNLRNLFYVTPDRRPPCVPLASLSQGQVHSQVKF